MYKNMGQAKLPSRYSSRNATANTRRSDSSGIVRENIIPIFTYPASIWKVFYDKILHMKQI